MGLFSRAKEAAGKAAESAKAKTAQMQQKKEEAAALDMEMREKAKQYAQSLVDQMTDSTDKSQGGLFFGAEEERILKFTAEFYEKIILPGSKTSSSVVIMHPYFNDKKRKAINKTFAGFEENIPLIYIKDDNEQELLITARYFYFKFALAENPKYFGVGSVPCADISLFEFELQEGQKYVIKCGECQIAEISLKKAHMQDFVSLSEYFRRFQRKDFEITNEETDKCIRQKIGTKIYDDIRKYTISEDELLLFYAGGLDSLTATDYVACTTRQIIIVDREMMGATSNVKQFYYEDITSMASQQNSKSSDLFTAVIDAALTSALQVCDLIITVSGSVNKISTLSKIEAERVIAIYHEKRNELKTQSNIQQMIVQQEKAPDVFEQLEKLAKLREQGILTEAEFTAKKAVLLEKI